MVRGSLSVLAAASIAVARRYALLWIRPANVRSSAMPMELVSRLAAPWMVVVVACAVTCTVVPIDPMIVEDIVVTSIARRATVL